LKRIYNPKKAPVFAFGYAEAGNAQRQKAEKLKADFRFLYSLTPDQFLISSIEYQS
jgi:hypothetical protein